MSPRDTWPDKAAYDAQAKKLADMFAKNIEKFGDAVTEAVRKAGPKP
jgi:phosphoenolpyruvate carboxykinase (ATP)